MAGAEIVPEPDRLSVSVPEPPVRVSALPPTWAILALNVAPVPITAFTVLDPLKNVTVSIPLPSVTVFPLPAATVRFWPFFNVRLSAVPLMFTASNPVKAAKLLRSKVPLLPEMASVSIPGFFAGQVLAMHPPWVYTMKPLIQGLFAAPIHAVLA